MPARIYDFCAYESRARYRLDGMKEPTVRDFFHAFERELACGSRFFLVSPDESSLTELHDPMAITVCYVKTSADEKAGKLAIFPTPERCHIFKQVETAE